MPQLHQLRAATPRHSLRMPDGQPSGREKAASTPPVAREAAGPVTPYGAFRRRKQVHPRPGRATTPPPTFVIMQKWLQILSFHDQTCMITKGRTSLGRLTDGMGRRPDGRFSTPPGWAA
jgi:hypothetical protein